MLMSSSETGKGARVLVPKNCTSDSFVSKNATSMRTQQILFCVCDQGIFIHLSNTWVTITFNPPNYYVQGNSMYSLLEPEKKAGLFPVTKKSGKSGRTKTNLAWLLHALLFGVIQLYNFLIQKEHMPWCQPDCKAGCSVCALQQQCNSFSDPHC
jgi:hypothetical protein